MRKLIIALALSTTAAASPALARDGSPYVGIDLGGMVVEDTTYEFSVDDDADPVDFVVDHKVGFDLGAFAGHDFGWVRVEGEIAYKRAGVTGVTITPGEVIDADGRSSALSGMVNALLDFESDRWGGFVGPGIGVARVSHRIDPNDDDEFDGGFRDRDTAWAWQILAGVRYAMSPNMDVGVKYRYFNAPGLHFPSDISFERVDGDFRSHSLMASLAYNFGAPPVVVVPPPVVVEQAPPPPATQTCPDGSVILATAVCPPPPPPPPGERG